MPNLLPFAKNLIFVIVLDALLMAFFLWVLDGIGDLSVYEMVSYLTHLKYNK